MNRKKTRGGAVLSIKVSECLQNASCHLFGQSLTRCVQKKNRRDCSWATFRLPCARKLAAGRQCQKSKPSRLSLFLPSFQAPKAVPSPLSESSANTTVSVGRFEKNSSCTYPGTCQKWGKPERAASFKDFNKSGGGKTDRH